MEFTPEETSKLKEHTRGYIKTMVVKIVEWSFTQRPMLNRTEAEERRRDKICEDYWRRMVWEHGIDAMTAAGENLPTCLIEQIDHDSQSARTTSLIEHPGFETGMFPSRRDQMALVEPERALSALSAKKKGP